MIAKHHLNTYNQILQFMHHRFGFSAPFESPTYADDTFLYHLVAELLCRPVLNLNVLHHSERSQQAHIDCAFDVDFELYRCFDLNACLERMVLHPRFEDAMRLHHKQLTYEITNYEACLREDLKNAVRFTVDALVEPGVAEILRFDQNTVRLSTTVYQLCRDVHDTTLRVVGVTEAQVLEHFWVTTGSVPTLRKIAALDRDGHEYDEFGCLITDKPTLSKIGGMDFSADVRHHYRLKKLQLLATP